MGLHTFHINASVAQSVEWEGFGTNGRQFEPTQEHNFFFYKVLIRKRKNNYLFSEWVLIWAPPWSNGFHTCLPPRRLGFESLPSPYFVIFFLNAQTLRAKIAPFRRRDFKNNFTGHYQYIKDWFKKIKFMVGPKVGWTIHSWQGQTLC